MLDLQKADELTKDAAELYELLIYGNPAEEEYARLRKLYGDVDTCGLLPAVYALRGHKFESRGWKRQRDRIFKKARRYMTYCEGERNGV